MNTVLMSIPVPVTWWSRAQVHSISPLPQARSSIRVPGGGLSAWPKVASLSLVNGLWMRWLLSRMVKLRGRSTSGLLVRDGLWHSGAPAIVPGEGLRVVRRPPGHCPGCAGTGVSRSLGCPAVLADQPAENLLALDPGSDVDNTTGLPRRILLSALMRTVTVIVAGEFGQD